MKRLAQAPVSEPAAKDEKRGKEKPEAGREDPLPAGLSDQEKVQIRQFEKTVAKMPFSEARAILQRLEPQLDSAAPANKPFMEALHRLLQRRIRNECD